MFIKKAKDIFAFLLHNNVHLYFLNFIIRHFLLLKKYEAFKISKISAKRTCGSVMLLLLSI